MYTEERMQSRTTDVNALLEELRQAGEEPAPALLDGIKALGSAAIRPLVALATDEALHNADPEDPEGWAPLHAIEILGELGAAEAVEPLLPLLEWHDDALIELLPVALGRIGQPAVAPLRALLSDHSGDMWTRESAAAALAHVAQHHPDARDEVVAILVEALDAAEPHTPASETLSGMIVSRLLDLEAKEAAPAIARAFADDRVDQRIVDLAWARYELGLGPEPRTPFPRQDKGLHLWLRCTACGFERPHDVEKVYYDLGTMERRKRGEETPYGEFVIPRQITCPKCGAVDSYELTGEAHLALTAEVLKQVAEAKASRRPGDDAERALVYTRFTVAGGREVHPYEGRDMYRQQVAAEPDNADLRVRYASVLRFLGQRDEAACQYQAALGLDPSNAEAYLSLGLFARDADDHAEARRLFERLLEVLPQARMSRGEREEYVSQAREELERLEGPRRGAAPRAASVPASLAAGFANGTLAPGQPARSSHKVGRNDPCPCGSGKKYKKCCGG